jgi:hypothetical protein
MSDAQTLYNLNRVDRLDPEKAQTVRNVGGGDASAANQTALLAQGALATAAPTNNIAAATTGTVICNANTSRKWVFLRNDSTSIAYVAKGATVSASSCYVMQPQGTLYFDDYNGVVTAVWVTATGFMRIEEGT